MKSPIELLRNNGSTRAASPRGMTLVEIMIVITIMASIMGVVGFYVFGTLNQANKKNAKMGMKNLSQMLESHYMMKGHLPDNLDELAEGQDPFVEKKSDLTDPWGNKYIYEKTGNQDFNLRSVGPDGDQGTEDDVPLNDEGGGS